MNLIISYTSCKHYRESDIYSFSCLHGGISPSWHRVSWQNKSTHQGMQCVFSSLFRPITKLMWIPACNETNLQADTPWKGKDIRETTLLINGFKLKTTKSSSCRPAVCFNDCGMGPDVGLSRFSHCPMFSVNSLWIIGACYRGILVSAGQSHDISLWSILSLGNRSINVEMIYKLRVFDINWCLITLIIYVQTLKRLLGELTRGYDTSI